MLACNVTDSSTDDEYASPDLLGVSNIVYFKLEILCAGTIKFELEIFCTYILI